MKLFAPLLLSFGLAAATLSGVEEASPAYTAERSLAGTIRIWGPVNMSALARTWAEGFRRVQPGVTVEINLMGSDTAIPGLYSGRADIAFLGRENNITDDNGFFRPMQYKPERFELTTGSLDVPGKSSALVVFVHRDNPLSRLTLAQLDAIFGHERRRRAPEAPSAPGAISGSPANGRPARSTSMATTRRRAPASFSSMQCSGAAGN
jgi:ABC-type phosphate transport system substrate-binding protein